MSNKIWFVASLNLYNFVPVSNYFATEPEEIVLARVHSLVIQKHVDAAMSLAKLSFLYHSRIAGHLSSARQRRGSVEGASSLGHASIDWYAFLLQRTKTLPQIVSEVSIFLFMCNNLVICSWNRRISYCFVEIRESLLKQRYGTRYYKYFSVVS